jgi:hypothetical protein
MKSARTFGKLLLVAGLALPVLGCRGCDAAIKLDLRLSEVDWDGFGRELTGQMYLHHTGPFVLTNAVGAAASSGGFGGMSLLTTEIAWRQSCEQRLNGEHDARCAASAVGTAGVPGGCGGLSTLVTIAAREDWGGRLGEASHLPCLFEVQNLNQEIARPLRQPAPQEAIGRRGPMRNE